MTLRISAETFTKQRQLMPAPEREEAFIKATKEALLRIGGCDFGAAMLKDIDQAGSELVIVIAGAGVENMCAQKLDTDAACDAACYQEVLSTETLLQKLKSLNLASAHPARRKFAKFYGEGSVHRAEIDGVKVPLAHTAKKGHEHGADQVLANRIQLRKFDGIDPVKQAVGWVRQLQNGLVGYHVMDTLTPGAGTGAWVVWNPDQVDADPKLAEDKRAKWMRRPPWIALAHELIHGWRLVSGRCVFRPNSRSEAYYEEAMTVGLPPYDGCRYTENRFRSRSEEPLRKYYGEKTQAQSAAAQQKHGSVEDRLGTTL